MTVDEFFELSWYELYLLIESQNIINEKEKLHEELEWVRLTELLTPIHNFMYKRDDGQAWKPTDFYKPSWYKEEELKEERTPEEILSKFPKKL